MQPNLTSDVDAPRTGPTGWSDEPSRIHYLDFARFFAASIVAVYHFNAESPTPRGGLFQYGNMGVQFFFLISGFVIALSARGTSAVPFLTKRFIRLAPTLWMAALILGLIKLALGSHADHPISPKDLLGNLTFVSLTPFAHALHCDRYVIQPIWTLGYEIYFYILIALTGLALNGRGRQLFMYAWLLVSSFETFRPGIVGPAEHAVRSYSMYEAAPFFAGGYFLSVLYEHRKLRPVEWGALTVCVALSLRHSYQLGSVMSNWRAPWGPPLPTDATGVVLVACFWAFFAAVIFAKGSHRNQRPKTLKLELALGAASYPMYLFHPLFNPTIKRLTHILHSDLLAMGVALAGTIGVALLVVKFLEKPIQRLLRKLLLPSRPIPADGLISSPPG